MGQVAGSVAPALASARPRIDAPPWMLLGGLAQPGVLIRPVPPEELPEHERGESQVLVAQLLLAGEGDTIFALQVSK